MQTQSTSRQCRIGGKKLRRRYKRYTYTYGVFYLPKMRSLSLLPNFPPPLLLRHNLRSTLSVLCCLLSRSSPYEYTSTASISVSSDYSVSTTILYPHRFRLYPLSIILVPIVVYFTRTHTLLPQHTNTVSSSTSIPISAMYLY